MLGIPFLSPLVILFSSLTNAYLVPPPGTAAPGTDADCTAWVIAGPGVTCALVLQAYRISEADFEVWNPITTEIGSSCSLIEGFDYCVEVNYVLATTGLMSTVTSTATTLQTSTISTISTTSTTATVISTPSPIQTGIVSDCNKFYLVQSGDTCSSVASAAGISLTDFYAWNPAVGSSCAYLDVADYVCVDIPGVTPTSSIATTTTTPTDGVSTPSPIQTGLISTCDKFYLVQSGDSCAAVASAAGISLSEFYAWNPAVGSSCSYLDVGDYVCVDIIGSTVNATSTAAVSSTTTTNGVSTPSPIQTGLVSNCNKFYLVQSGDTCSSVASAAGISLTDFYAWNPAVGSSCAYLDVGDYVCVDIIGYTVTTTTSGGVSTPSPIQTGMVSDCDKFYLVQSGDGCANVASAAGISLADFYAWNPAVGTSCAYLDVGDYVCIDIPGVTPTATAG